jgi:hypothetical protein
MLARTPRASQTASKVLASGDKKLIADVEAGKEKVAPRETALVQVRGRPCARRPR